MAQVYDGDRLQPVTPPLLCSCRLAISITCCMGLFWALFSYNSLGMVIVCMEQSTATEIVGNHSTEYLDALENPISLTTSSTSSGTEKDSLLLNKENQGLLFAAPYYTSIFMSLVGGWLADRYQRYKLFILLGLTLAGLINVVSPFLIEQNEIGYYLSVRVLMGCVWCFGALPMWPLMNRWCTPKDVGLLICLVNSGMELASGLTYPISACLCEYSGWKSIFFFNGTCCFLWCLVAFFVIYDNPDTHPRVDATERQYLLSLKEKLESNTRGKVAIPWKSFLLSVPVWSVFITAIVFHGAAASTVIYLPLFFNDALKFSITEIGMFSCLPSLMALIIQLTSGPLFDFVRAQNAKRQWELSTTAIRKTFHAFGTVIPAILLFTASQLHPDQRYWIVAVIAIGHSFNQLAIIGGFNLCCLDLAPDFVGILQGLNNVGFAVQGLLVPVIVSAITTQGSREEWSHVYLMLGSFYITACLTYLILGSSELQPWGKSREAEKSTRDETLI